MPATPQSLRWLPVEPGAFTQHQRLCLAQSLLPPASSCPLSPAPSVFLALSPSFGHLLGMLPTSGPWHVHDPSRSG